jgi:hypothetical protein
MQDDGRGVRASGIEVGRPLNEHRELRRPFEEELVDLR